MLPQRLTRQPVTRSLVLTGTDGELYSLPAVRALYASGRLAPDSPAYAPLLALLRADPAAHGHAMA